MSVAANAGAKAGRDVAWSRRRALQSAGAAVVTAVGIAGHAQGAAAQSPSGSPAVAATPAIPADFKVVLHAAEVENWPYVLSNLKNLTQEWPQAQLRVVVDGSAVTSLQGVNNLTTELAQFAGAGVQCRSVRTRSTSMQSIQARFPATPRRIWAAWWPWYWRNTKDLRTSNPSSRWSNC